MSDEYYASLLRQRDELRLSLSLNAERQALFASPTEIPLQLLRDERALRRKLSEIEQEIEEYSGGIPSVKNSSGKEQAAQQRATAEAEAAQRREAEVRTLTLKTVEIQGITCHGHPFKGGIAISPDAKKVAVGILNEIEVHNILDISTGMSSSPHESLEFTTPRRGYVESLAFTPDGKFLLSSQYNGTFLWDIDKHEAIREDQSKSMQEDITISTKGETYYSGNGIWRVSDFESVFSIDAETAIRVATYSSNDDFIAIGFENGSIEVWSLSERKVIWSIEGKNYTEVTGLCFTRDNRFLASSHKHGGVYVWDIATQNKYKSYNMHNDEVLFLTWIKDAIIFFVYKNGNVYSRDCTDYFRIGVEGNVPIEIGRVSQQPVAWAAEKQVLAILANDKKKVRLWKIELQ